MIQALSALLFLFSMNASAQLDQPTKYCDDNNQCTDQMREIIAKYKEGSAQFANEELSAFSGVCYPLRVGYEPEEKHFGAFVFERKGSDLLTAGVFSFDEEVDPAAHMNASEIKNWFIARNSQFHQVTVAINHIELSYRMPYTVLRYWFRTNQKSSQMHLIVSQLSYGDLTYVFCEFDRK